MKDKRPRRHGPQNGGKATPATKSATKEASEIKFRQISVIYGEGQELCFQFPIQVTEDDMAHRIEAALKMPNLCISTGEALYVIPTHAILTVIVRPVPKRLPPTVIRGARLIGLDGD